MRTLIQDINVQIVNEQIITETAPQNWEQGNQYINPEYNQTS